MDDVKKVQTEYGDGELCKVFVVAVKGMKPLTVIGDRSTNAMAWGSRKTAQKICDTVQRNRRVVLEVVEIKPFARADQAEVNISPFKEFVDHGCVCETGACMRSTEFVKTFDEWLEAKPDYSYLRGLSIGEVHRYVLASIPNVKEETKVSRGSGRGRYLVNIRLRVPSDAAPLASEVKEA